MKLRVFGVEIWVDERHILSPSPQEIEKQVKEYLEGNRFRFDVKLDYSKLSADMARFMKALQQVEYGETITYGELGKILGMHPRKVGVLCARNPLPLIVPCHRVVGASGLGGYAYGVELKKKLLELEQKNSRKWRE